MIVTYIRTKPLFIKLLCSLILPVWIFCLISSLYSITCDAASQLNEEQIRNDVTRAVQEMEQIMQKSYENAQKELENQCKNGYDYELSLESFQDQGLPFANFDYKNFIAAYATIQRYCNNNQIDMGEGINQINFVLMETTEATVMEYIPEQITLYAEASDGTYIEDGIGYLTEPSDIDVYELDSETGRYIKTGTEYHNLNTTNTKYLEVTLSTITIEEVYQTFGLERSDFQDMEDARLDKIKDVLGLAELDQLVFIQNATGATDEEIEILNESLNLTDSKTRQKMISIAGSIIGRVPYEWGGKSDKAGYDDTWYTFDNETQKQKGLDCSGYIQWILRTANYEDWEELVSTTSFLTSDKLVAVTAQELQPGDFGLFYPDSSSGTNHIGMYLGNGYWIHCSSTVGSVTISSVTKFSIYRRLKALDELENPALVTETTKTDETSNALVIEEDTHAEQADSEAAIEEADAIEEQTVKEVTEATEENTEVVTTEQPEITESTSEEAQPEESVSEEPATDVYIETTGEAVTYSQDELYLMAKIVTKESYGEGYNGWVGVAQVIYNRVRSSKFPDTVNGVLTASGQFSTLTAAQNMSNGDIDQNVLTVCEQVLRGELKIFDCDTVIGFKRGDTEKFGKWIKYTTLGNHTFYKLS